mgnify:CR=1 FL=1
MSCVSILADSVRVLRGRSSSRACTPYAKLTHSRSTSASKRRGRLSSPSPRRTMPSVGLRLNVGMGTRGSARAGACSRHAPCVTYVSRCCRNTVSTSSITRRCAACSAVSIASPASRTTPSILAPARIRLQSCSASRSSASARCIVAFTRACDWYRCRSRSIVDDRRCATPGSSAACSAACVSESGAPRACARCSASVRSARASMTWSCSSSATSVTHCSHGAMSSDRDETIARSSCAANDGCVSDHACSMYASSSARYAALNGAKASSIYGRQSREPRSCTTGCVVAPRSSASRRAAHA